MNLQKKVKEKLLQLGTGPEDTYLVAVSGGADSTALLLTMLAALGTARNLTVAHLDHGIRPGSRQDLEKVVELCSKSGVGLVTGQLDPVELEAHRRNYGSLEAGMRFLRYRFLFETAKKAGSKWILTGHTADDQAETVLFRATREMDWRSLGGIPERRGMILRPLIDVPRSATWSYCQVMNVSPVSDPSNFDGAYARSRIRNRILPGLAATFNPDICDLLRRMGRAAGSLSLMEEDLLHGFLPDPGHENPGFVERETLLALPGILQKRLIGDFLVQALREYPSRALVDDALEFVLAGRNGQLSLPGEMTLTLSYGLAHVDESVPPSECGLPSRPLELKVPGSLIIPSAGLAITAKEKVLKNPVSYPCGKSSVLLSKKGLTGSLWVRKRLPGDRFMPIGMERDKKLKDFLVDRKIPRAARDRIPIILDGKDNILWVGGIEISQKAVLEGMEGEEAILLSMEELSSRDSPITNRCGRTPRVSG
ncbi:MAG: tRNA lysidine(34) synthetase TilS [bacterium]|nr:tRNA lysidine(34) synthetase TilS [bacterium]MDT8366185.1 tRNA lysidine(34) synthetase TilS [bacterium]